VALVVRVGFVAATTEYVPFADASDYDRHAISLKEEGRYPPSAFGAPGSPSAFRPPGYPYAVAAAYAVTGKRLSAARLMNALLGVSGVLFVFLIALEIWGRRVALLAGSFASVFPPLVFMAGSLLAENLFVPLVLAATWAALRGSRAESGRARLAWAAGAGALVAASALTRTNGLLLFIPLIVALAGRPRSGEWGRALAAPACALAAGLVVLVPWTLRNTAAFDEYVPVSTQAGYTLAGTYNETARAEGNGLAMLPNAIPEFSQLFLRPGIDEVDIDDELTDDAFSFVADHPTYALSVLWRNGLRWYDLSSDPAYTSLWYQEADLTGDRKSFAFLGAWLALLGAAAALLLPRSRRLARQAPGWIWLMPGLIALSSLIVVGNPRYRWAVDPFLLLLCALAAEGFLRRRSDRRPAPQPSS
jgi:4-amino-4-deoxy-L-arabinose transferase-like glycosyltransferase